MKKVLATLLAMVMMFAMTTTVFAANDHAHTITITGKPGHTYAAYQVFVGDISSGKLTNIEWGNGIVNIEDSDPENDDDLLMDLKTLAPSPSPYAACNTAEDVATILQGYADDSEQIIAFADVVNNRLVSSAAITSTETTVDANTSTYSIPVVGDGYYFIKDVGAIPTGGTNTEYILKVVSNVSVTAKDGVVTSEKKVMDKDDSTGVSSGWQDSADYDIGDYVPFKLSATLPSNYEEYEKYSLTFHDHEVVNTGSVKSGLTFVNSATHPVVVKIDGVVVDPSLGLYEVVSMGDIECTFEVRFIDMTKTNATNNSVVTVEYYSLLSENAILGEDGNINEMHVTYTNDIHQGGEKGKTKEDAVIVFTYQTVVNKVDQTGSTALAGATFKLEKFVANPAGSTDYKGTLGDWVEKAVVKNAEGTTFTFKGLDDGQYKLTEVKAPEGYNKIAPIEFTVAAQHDENSDAPTLTALTGTVTTGTINFTPDAAKTTLATTIENRQGATLPSTGGIGTTVFYFAGTVLVLGAAVLLVTKKRMSI